jgi:serine/threonine-protein kinase
MVPGVWVCPKCRSRYVTQTRGAGYCRLDGEALIERESDPWVGEVIDRYCIEEKLAEGGMSSIYRARHVALDRECALKVLSGEIASDRELVARLQREAHAVARLDHPNVVKLFDFGETPAGLPYLVMELIPGRSLDRVLIAEAPFPAARVAGILRQVVAGLAEVHRRGFVHRDLKPSNVMLVAQERGERAVILDFGLAQPRPEAEGAAIERLTRTGITVGTPAYMAPERMRGELGTPASDFYALGALLYEMLSGRPPFLGEVTEIVARQLSGTPDPLPVTTGLEPLALRLLAVDPAARPQSAAAVIAAIDSLGLSTRGQAWTSEDTGEVGSSEVRALLGPDRGRWRAIGGAIAALVAAALAVAAIAAYLRGEITP